MKRHGFSALLAVALLIAQPGIVSAQTGQAALLAWNDGNPTEAARRSAAALRQNPNDARAALVQALLARAVGNPQASFSAAATAYHNADLDALRFDAAVLAAEALVRQEKFTRAQFWLRRARQAAPDDRRRDMSENLYRETTKRNPLAFRLQFSVRPSNNVNNGAETAEIEIVGRQFLLDDSGLQLSGTQAETGLSFSYRLQNEPTQRTELLGEVFYRKVWLTSDAKAAAPGASGSDFDYGVIAAGLRHTRLIWPDLGPTSVSTVVGQSWYGGEELARWGDLRMSQTFELGKTSAWRIGGGIRSEARQDDAINDSFALTVRGDYLRLHDDGGQSALGIYVRDVSSDSATVERFEIGASAARTFDRIGPVIPSLRVTADTRNYRDWIATPGWRQDSTLGLRLGLAWPDADYFGFAPQLNLTARRTWSDVDIYDRNEASISLGLVSLF